MKRFFTYSFALIFMLVAVVGCSKKESELTLTDKEQKDAIVGKWERTSISIAGYKNGKIVTPKIAIKTLLDEIDKELPPFYEFTETKIFLIDPKSDENPSQSYTVDTKQSTIIVINEGNNGAGLPLETRIKYKFKNNKNTLELNVRYEDVGLIELYDEFRAIITLERIESWPFERA